MKKAIQKIKIAVGFLAGGYIFLSVWNVVYSLNATFVQHVVAAIAIFLWFVWTAFELRDRKWKKDRNNLVFQYSRIMDGFPEEFEKFCEEKNIEATEEFVKRAVKKEMYRIEKEEKERAGS